MQTLCVNLRHGLRLLVRDRAVTLASIVALGVSIGALTTAFSAIDAVLIRPLPYPKPEGIVVLSQRFEARGSTGATWISGPEFADYRDQNHTLEFIDAYTPAEVSLTGIGEPERLHASAVTPTVFRVLQAAPVVGRVFLDEEGQPGRNNSVVLSYGLWQRRFGGDRSAIGKNIAVNGRQRTIAGVMPAAVTFPDEPDIWLPLALTPEMLAASQRPARNLEVVARLKPGVSIGQAREDMAAIVRRFPDSALRNSVAGLLDSLVGDVRPTLLILTAVSALVLLIGCGNVATLLLARAAARGREVAIRTALGAGRRTLVVQFLTESVMLALAGGAAGLLLATWGISILRTASPGGIPRLTDATIDLRLAGFLLAVTMATGVLFGLAPALAGSGHTLGSRGVRVSGAGALVVSQLAITFVLLAGAGLLIESFARLTGIAPGFRPDHIITFEVSLPQARYPQPAARGRFFHDLVDRLRSIPGVRFAAAASDLPFAGTSSDRSFVHDGMDPATFRGSPPSADQLRSTPDYFRTMAIPLRAGRFFDQRDDGAMVAIVNEKLAQRMWPGSNPIGRRINFFVPGGMEGWRTVVGVVGDVRRRGFAAEPRMEIHVPAMQSPIGTMAVLMRTEGDPSAFRVAAQKAVQASDPDLPVYHVRTMEELIGKSVAAPRFHMLVVGGFAAVALILAVTGLFGVMAHWVNRRTQELGVRMALGAKTEDLLRLVIGKGLRLAALGVVLGAAGGFALTRLLERMLFGVRPADPVVFTANGLLLLVTAAVASYIPARRAARVDPLAAVRHE